MNPAVGRNAHSDAALDRSSSYEALLKPKDLAHRWGISTGHLANQRSAGVGVGWVKLGGVVRYRLADVLAYEAASLVEAA